MPRGQFKHRYWFFADTSNIAGNCRVIWKIYNGEPIRFLPSSQTLCRIYNTVFSVKWEVWKVWRNLTLCRYWETVLDFKWQKLGSQSTFRPLTGWGLHRFFWKFNPPLFSLVNTFKRLARPGIHHGSDCWMILKYEHSLRAAFNIYQEIWMYSRWMLYLYTKNNVSVRTAQNTNTAAAKNVSYGRSLKRYTNFHLPSYSRQSTTFRKLLVF